jgi:hypothetical protein
MRLGFIRRRLRLWEGRLTAGSEQRGGGEEVSYAKGTKCFLPSVFFALREKS